jgi:hypothetical protein
VRVLQAQRARGVRGDAASASGTVRPNSVQAMFAISSRLRAGEVPGLWSVATAMDTPAARSAAMGGRCVSRSV